MGRRILVECRKQRPRRQRCCPQRVARHHRRGGRGLGGVVIGDGAVVVEIKAHHQVGQCRHSQRDRVAQRRGASGNGQRGLAAETQRVAMRRFDGGVIARRIGGRRHAGRGDGHRRRAVHIRQPHAHPLAAHADPHDLPNRGIAQMRCGVNALVTRRRLDMGNHRLAPGFHPCAGGGRRQRGAGDTQQQQRKGGWKSDPGSA